MAEQNDIVATTKALTLVETAQILERLMGEVEDAEQVTTEMTLEIQAMKDLQVAKIDRVIQVFDAAGYHMRVLEEEQKILAEKMKRLRDRTDTLKQYCMETMKAFPNQVFKGRTKQLAIQKNGGMSSLKVNIPTTERLISRIISEEDAALLPSQYHYRVNLPVLDPQIIRRDIEGGIELDWAKLERGEHLRIR